MRGCKYEISFAIKSRFFVRKNITWLMFMIILTENNSRGDIIYFIFYTEYYV